MPVRLPAALSPSRLLAVLLVVAAAAVSAVFASSAPAQTHVKKCGKVPGLGVEVEATKVSCGKAIRIVAAYQASGVGEGLPKKVPGFPGWECSSGDRLGTCARGGYKAGTPTISFPYLKAPGEARLEFGAGGPPCTKRALTKGLHRSGLRGYIDRDTFGCAGRFAFAGVIVDRNEITVLFRATHERWHSASRAHYCEDGAVPKQIYRPACESN